MTTWGYTLSSEEFGPRQLVEQAAIAEEAGFDFLTVSDHFHPWTQSQGHSPFVWTTIGGVAMHTTRIPIGTGVTCPILRNHPTMVAQAAATSSAILGGRFFLGVGTGEWLNEHITGGAWPAVEIRRTMLAEAVDVMRQLWTGDTVDHWGEYYTVENARLFTEPAGQIPVIWAAAGAESTLCWALDRAEAVKTALEVWPNAGNPGQLSQDLPTWTHFENVAELVTEEIIADRIPCGPDASPVVELVRKYEAAGFDQIHFHQVGPDQRGFFDFWRSELSDALG